MKAGTFSERFGGAGAPKAGEIIPDEIGAARQKLGCANNSFSPMREYLLHGLAMQSMYSTGNKNLKTYYSTMCKFL
jgi:hypothetical protein